MFLCVCIVGGVRMNESDDLKAKIEEYQWMILKLAITYLKNVESAKDIVQEVFITYYNTKPAFQTYEHEKAWFLRVTMNKCKNERRKKFYQWFSLDEKLISATTKDHVDLLKAVWSLEIKYRLPIHLYYYEGYSIKEIASILNEKEATIGTRLKRAKEKLRVILGGDYLEE